MNRRQFLFGVGTGTTVLVAGCSRPMSDSDTPDHFVHISNARETAHEVFVELDFEGEEDEYGPRTIEPGDSWEVNHFESDGELTVRVSVDDERIWEDVHEIPTPGGNRRSFAQVELLPGDDVRAHVMQED